jgi:predicted hotdog family 3-hydroxylacyl-ACP dehydratase
MTEFPPIAALLPHRGRAVLLQRVVAHDAASTTCEVDPAGSTLWKDEHGTVAAAVALEYMAQTIAAHGGLADLESGREARPGFFLGTRRLEFRVDRFVPGELLEVTARHLRGSTGMLAFECSIRRARGLAPVSTGEAASAGAGPASPDEAEPMVSGVLTVYLLESFEALTRDFADADAAGGAAPGSGSAD